MKVLGFAAAAVALFTVLPAAAATTIDFEKLPSGAALPSGGTTITDQFQSLGVTFSGTNTSANSTGPLNAWGVIAATGAGSGNALASFGAIPAGGPSNYLLAPKYDVMSVMFTTTASGISFALKSGTAVTINAYNSAGTVVQSLLGVSSSPDFALETLSATGVARVDIVRSTPGYFYIDNLTFTANAATAAVPEPATWGMMIVGFGAMGFAMRRRATRTARVRFA